MKVGCWVMAQAGFLPGGTGASRDGLFLLGGRGEEEGRAGLKGQGKH